MDRRRRPSPEVGFWLALIEALIGLGRRHTIVATGVVSFVLTLALIWLIVELFVW